MRATLGSMVQKGKLAACASDLRASALKSVDLPTLGRPMMPTRTFMTIPQPLLRGRRRAALQWPAALPVIVLVGATRPRAAALGLASIKHAKLKVRMALADPAPLEGQRAPRKSSPRQRSVGRHFSRGCVM